MISSHALSTFIIHHDINGLYDKNLRSIQYLMFTSKPAGKKIKHVWDYFPNLAILTKSAIPGNLQPIFVHVSVGKKSLR